MSRNGFFKVFYNLFEKPIWLNSSPQHKSVLIALISLANHKENQWEWNGQKFDLLPGQFITSLESIRQRCGKGVSQQNVRTALKRFEKLEFLTNKSTKTGRLITIINWDTYQGCYGLANKATNKDLTKSQQRGNKEVTPNEERKTYKNVRSKENIYADFSEKTETEKPEPNIKPDIPYQEIVSFLNEQLGTRYSPKSKKTVGLINARFSEGFTLDDFKAAIEFKCREWAGDSKMAKFLTPDTLFSGKFEKYVNQAIQKKPKQVHRRKEIVIND